MSRGAEFGDVKPLRTAGGPLAVTPFTTLTSSSFGAGDAINTAVIQQVAPLNSFRLGQQLVFWLGVRPGIAGGQWASRVRLKLWWLRPNKQYRAPGTNVWLPIDKETFFNGPAPTSDVTDNRYCWIPSPKRLDVTPYGTAPPAVPPLPNSDSALLDDCLVLDLPDPNDPVYQAKFVSPQVVSRWVTFLYPAMGYSLGMTWDATGGGQGAVPGVLDISLNWASGTLGGSNYQESVG